MASTGSMLSIRGASDRSSMRAAPSRSVIMRSRRLAAAKASAASALPSASSASRPVTTVSGVRRSCASAASKRAPQLITLLQPVAFLPLCLSAARSRHWLNSPIDLAQMVKLGSRPRRGIVGPGERGDPAILAVARRKRQERPVGRRHHLRAMSGHVAVVAGPGRRRQIERREGRRRHRARWSACRRRISPWRPVTKACALAIAATAGGVASSADSSASSRAPAGACQRVGLARLQLRSQGGS